MTLAERQAPIRYQDYAQWDDDGRWEIIDGVAYNMSPSPGLKHQQVSMSLSRIAGNCLAGKRCSAFHAPTDVILSDHDVVQPDLFIVCDPGKMKDKGVFGAPDVVFEILSPSTAKHDRWEKKQLYERFGVKEYLLIDPDGCYAERFVLVESGKFNEGEVFGREDAIVLTHVPDVIVPLGDVFTSAS